jgi:hypothetical protein
MCDYSLHHVASRPAKVGDQLTTRDFGTGTRGFAAAEDAFVAVCVLPGTELAFAKPVEYATEGLLGWAGRRSKIEWRFSGRSTKNARRRITTRWSFLTARSSS